MRNSLSRRVVQATMRTLRGAFTLLLAASTVAAAAVGRRPLPSRKYCQRGQACWPSTADLARLTRALDPDRTRRIRYEGGNSTYPAPIPAGSDQPLFGFGASTNLPPVVVADAPTGPCFVGSNVSLEKRPACLAATRNNEGRWNPAFVVFPLQAGHVVEAVNFARRHNLCVSVLGTGHDFMNRHDGCPDGFLIRTTLLKSIEWNLDDTRWQTSAGTVRVGSGHTFSEVHRSASDHQRIVASGWTRTVGVAGWSLGGMCISHVSECSVSMPRPPSRLSACPLTDWLPFVQVAMVRSITGRGLGWTIYWRPSW
jgi:hypothetical protein